MGSLISLGLGELELDWGKNSFFRNHSALFCPDDVREVSYHYAGGIQERKPAFVRPLGRIVKRLEMLGYTLEDCRGHYLEAVSDTPDYYPAPLLTWDDFAQLLAQVNVADVTLTEAHEDDFDLGEYVSRVVLRDPAFLKVNPRLAALTTDDGTFFENLDPYVALRLLAENPANQGLDVVWRYADVLEGGWVREDEVYEGLPDTAHCLVVTEGATDGDFLKATLPVVLPEIRDFFTFVDMSENYPFTGTGNLCRFCQGLVRIGIQNRILVVLDNDTVGRETFARITGLPLPPRMTAMVLPDLEECRHVRTLGPAGEFQEDINGRALSIEWFADLTLLDREPTVRWTAYSDQSGSYQGELIGKRDYLVAFLTALRQEKPVDLAKSRILWEALFRQCTATLEARQS